MPNTDAYVADEGSLQIPSREETAQAFGHVLSSRLASFYRSAHRVLGNVADAEDAVQDALLAAFTHLDQFKGQSEMSTWMTAIVHNCALLQLRSRRNYIHVSIDEPVGGPDTVSLADQLPDRGPTPEDECQHFELSAYLTRFYGKLSPTLRRTFRLRDIEGFSIRETAQILKIPRGTVKAQSARARRKVKELMQRALRPRSRAIARHKARESSKVTV